MFNSSHSIKIKDLLVAWMRLGMVAPHDQFKLERFIVTAQSKKPFPIYLNLIVGLAVIIASLCFFFFLNASGWFVSDTRNYLLEWGSFFIITAIFLLRLSNKAQNLWAYYVIKQLSFCAIALGKPLFVCGTINYFYTFQNNHDDLVALLVIFFLTLVSYPFYDVFVERCLSVFATLMAIFYNIISQRYFGFLSWMSLDFFFFLQLSLILFLCLYSKVKFDYISVLYGTVLSLCVIVVCFTLNAHNIFVESFRLLMASNPQRYYSLIGMNVLLVLYLVGLLAWVAGHVQRFFSEPLLLALLGAIILGLISAPGILMSICLMILGYAQHHKFLSQAGLWLMPIFLCIYYHNIDVSLLRKSGILVGSGVILLLGWAYLSLKRTASQ